MPDIPGEGLIALGRGIQQLAGGLSRYYSNTQEALLKGEETSEFLQAQRMAFNYIEDYERRIAPNAAEPVESDKIYPEWEETAARIQEEVGGFLKLQGAKDKFGIWWEPQNNKQTIRAQDLALDRFIAKNEAQVSTMVQDLALQGRPEDVKNTLLEAAEGGILEGSLARTMMDTYVPLAKYNAASRDLSVVDPDVALQVIADPEFGKTMDLTPAQVEALTRDIQFRKNNRDNAAKEQRTLDGDAALTDFIQKTKDVTEMAKLSRTDLTGFLLRVNPEDRGAVQKVIDHYDKDVEQQQKDDLGLDQDVEYSHQSQALQDWDGTGKQPFTLGDLTQMVRDKTITEGQRDKLEADLKTTKEELIKGERTPEQMRQHKNTSGIRSRLYAALDELKNPAVAVPLEDIEDLLASGAISQAQHDTLLANRESLRDDYTRRLEAAKKAEGPNLDDPTREAELW
ncbi:MAG TPA: hypothetical protein VM537_08975, partial [Anaerolineae bacterium]|nr:hypothetical protein [Anaerolineae bacterium]